MFYSYLTLSDVNDRLIDTVRKTGFNLSDFKSSPSVNIEYIDNPDSILVKAYLPGVAKEDVSVELDKGCLIIEGHRKKSDDVKYSEVNYGKFARSIPIDVEVDKTKTKAELRDGILQVTLLKVDGIRNWKVSIT